MVIAFSPSESLWFNFSSWVSSLFGEAATAVFAVALQGILNDGMSEIGGRQVVHLDGLAFQLLVILKEPPQHAQPVSRQLAGLFETVELGIVDGHGKNLVIALARVDHRHKANGPRLDERQRDDRFLAQDQYVERIVIFGQR